MRSQEEENDCYFLDGQDETCIGLASFVSKKDGVLVCSYASPKMTGPDIVHRYWFEEQENLLRLEPPVCPFTRQKIKFILIKNLPDDIQRKLFFNERLISDFRCLQLRLAGDDVRIKWHVLEEKSDLYCDISSPWLSAIPPSPFHLNIRSHVRAIIELLGLAFLQLIWIPFICLFFVLEVMKIAIHLPLALFLNSSRRSVVELVTDIWMSISFLIQAFLKNLVFITYAFVHIILLLVSLIAVPLITVNNAIHFHARSKNMSKVKSSDESLLKENFEKISLEQIENKIDAVVREYESSFRKRHSTLMSILSFGFFSTQQSESSAQLLSVLKKTQLNGEEKRRHIYVYLFESGHENQGKAMWKSIVTKFNLDEESHLGLAVLTSGNP